MSNNKLSVQRPDQERVIRIGKMLLEAKMSLAHGEWTGWLTENFEGSAGTASRYMRIARKAGNADQAPLVVSDSAPPAPPCWIYFIESGSGGPIKIGITTVSLRYRLSALQSGNPQRLTCLAGLPCDERGEYLERQLLLHFASGRISGEWFERDTLGLTETVEHVARYETLPPVAPATDAIVCDGCGWAREPIVGCRWCR